MKKEGKGSQRKRKEVGRPLKWEKRGFFRGDIGQLQLRDIFKPKTAQKFDDYIALDVVIGHAVRVGWKSRHPEKNTADYPQHKAAAWAQYYRSSPADCRKWQIEALLELAEQEALN